MEEARKRKRVGLALGGGVVRGIAHIGVLAVLERAGIPIDYVAGTSIGALIGAAYCAGFSAQDMQAHLPHVRWRDLISLTWPARGWVCFDKLERWLVALLGDLDFADLKRPFAAVATDLETGQAVVLREGRVARAVRASASVPGVVTPVEWNGRLLCDGFVSDIVPVAPLRAMGAEYVIGVDILTPQLRPHWGALGFLAAAVEILVRQAGGGLKQADCMITPALAGFSYLRLSKAAELIALGEKAAQDQLPVIQAALSTD